MVQDWDTHNDAEYGMGEITEKEYERVTCIWKIPKKATCHDNSQFTNSVIHRLCQLLLLTG